MNDVIRGEINNDKNSAFIIVDSKDKHCLTKQL